MYNDNGNYNINDYYYGDEVNNRLNHANTEERVEPNESNSPKKKKHRKKTLERMAKEHASETSGYMLMSEGTMDMMNPLQQQQLQSPTTSEMYSPISIQSPTELPTKRERRRKERSICTTDYVRSPVLNNEESFIPIIIPEIEETSKKISRGGTINMAQEEQFRAEAPTENIIPEQFRTESTRASIVESPRKKKSRMRHRDKADRVEQPEYEYQPVEEVFYQQPPQIRASVASARPQYLSMPSQQIQQPYQQITNFPVFQTQVQPPQQHQPQQQYQTQQSTFDPLLALESATINLNGQTPASYYQVQVGLPMQPVPMTSHQHQQIQIIMTLFGARTNVLFKSFYDTVYTLTTGVCLLFAIIFPIQGEFPEYSIPILSSAGWSTLNLFQILVTLSMLTALNELDTKRNYLSLFFALLTSAAFVASLICMAIEDNMAISQFDSLGGKYGNAGWFRETDKLTSFIQGDYVKYKILVNIRAFCIFGGFLLKVCTEFFGSFFSTSPAVKTAVTTSNSNAPPSPEMKHNMTRSASQAAAPPIVSTAPMNSTNITPILEQPENTGI